MTETSAGATKSRVAVIVAHPDDEVLAFGGSICRHAAMGDAVSILIMASGLTSRAASATPAPKELAELRAQGQKAAQLMGAAKIEFADFPDNRMDGVDLLDVVKRVEAFLSQTQADTVYTHHQGDLNIDHGVVARAVLTACRPLPGTQVKRLYAGEVLSSSEYALAQDRFQPDTYVNIEAYLERKCRALECYRDEIRAWPHPRSVEAIAAQARLRGSESGFAAAEALKLLREVRP